MSKFIGRKASKCNRCSGENHFVNKLGGIQCERCSPAKKESDVVLRLRIDGGFWQDQAAERFDYVDVHPNDVPSNMAVEPIHSAPYAAASIKTKEERELVRDWSFVETQILFTDMIWDQPDQFVVFKPRSRSKSKEASDVGGKVESPSGLAPQRLKPIPESQRKPLPAIGSEVKIKFRMETFGGFVQPGSAKVCGAGYDSLGNVVMNLERDGRVVASGVMFEKF